MATIALLAGGALQAQEGEKKKGGFQFTDEVTVPPLQ